MIDRNVAPETGRQHDAADDELDEACGRNERFSTKAAAQG